MDNNLAQLADIGVPDNREKAGRYHEKFRILVFWKKMEKCFVSLSRKLNIPMVSSSIRQFSANILGWTV